jgi:hypothetical protein
MAAPGQQQTTSAQPNAGQAEEKTAEQTHKNIQALKGLPDSQLLPVMQLFAASLGVKCDACHVRAADGKWEFDKDDKKMKQTARKMIQMTVEINKTNFEGHTDVSCYACHRGSERPVNVPPLPQPVEARAEGPKPVEAWPTPPQIIEKYVQAVGGKDAADKIKSLSIKGSFVTAEGASLPLELAYQSPGKLFTVVTTRQGPVTLALDGGTGWIKNERESRPLNPVEADRLKSLALSLQPMRFPTPLPRMIFAGKEKIGEREAYRIRMSTPDRRRMTLFFDVQSGLLLRRIVLRDTLIGADPEQTDYDDYRDVEGVKIPFSIRMSYPSNNLSGTRKFAEVKANTDVDAARFSMPK